MELPSTAEGEEMSWEFCDCCGCSPCDCDWGLYEEPRKETKEKESKEKEKPKEQPKKENPFHGKPIC